MQLKILHASAFVCVRASASACVRVRPRVSACVCVRLRASVCAQKIKRPDARLDAKGSLRPDASFVQGLSGCTIICNRCMTFKLAAL